MFFDLMRFTESNSKHHDLNLYAVPFPGFMNVSASFSLRQNNGIRFLVPRISITFLCQVVDSSSGSFHL